LELQELHEFEHAGTVVEEFFDGPRQALVGW
jgi:hypothetical protein